MKSLVLLVLVGYRLSQDIISLNCEEYFHTVEINLMVKVAFISRNVQLYKRVLSCL